jgi:predicted DNA-binding ribbon-helix-helix protein
MISDANTRGTDRQIKNLFVNGHRTSLRLEVAFWDGFETCARDQGKSIHQLANSALSQYAHITSSLSSAVRLLIINHFREKAMAAERDQLAGAARDARAGKEDLATLALSHGGNFLDAVRRLDASDTSDKALRNLLREIRGAIDRIV